MFRNSSWILRFTVALAFFLSGVGFSGSSAAQKSVKFRMDWKMSAAHGPFLIAAEKGFYKAEGLSVQVMGGSGSTDSLKLLGGGSIEFGLVDAPVIVQGRVKGVPVKSIAVYWQRTPQMIVWNAGKHDVKTPKDLIGLKVGVKHKSSTFQGFRAFTRAQGIDMKKDMKLVPIGFGVAPLLAGQVDALVGFTTSEPLRAADKGLKVKEFLFANYGVKMYGLTIASREDLIKSDGATVRSFLKASLRGIKYAADHPDEVAPSVKKKVTQAKLGQQKRIWKKVMKAVLFADGPGKRVGVQTSDGWGKTQNILFDLKLIENKVPVGSIYTNAFLP